MKLGPEGIEALTAAAADKGITIEQLLSALADAIEVGYKGQADAEENAWVTIDPKKMEISVMFQETNEDGELIGEEKDITPTDFGRITTQNIRYALTQDIRGIEWDQRYEEYAGREGEIVTGIVRQNDPRFTLLDLGSVEALLPSSEQVPYERHETGTRLKAYIVEVRHTAKGPQVVVSRTHPGLIKRLFEVEVPEIADGIVEILACSREPGHRTKISVYSHDENVDPLGACVGARGVRVRPIVTELNGEKIDIVTYSEDLKEYVSSALSPAKVKEVNIDEENNMVEVIVPAKQLSLAIGREGQNVRLATRLTGVSINMKDDGLDIENEVSENEEGEGKETKTEETVDTDTEDTETPEEPEEETEKEEVVEEDLPEEETKTEEVVDTDTETPETPEEENEKEEVVEEDSPEEENLNEGVNEEESSNEDKNDVTKENQVS